MSDKTENTAQMLLVFACNYSKIIQNTHPVLIKISTDMQGKVRITVRSEIPSTIVANFIFNASIVQNVK